MNAKHATLVIPALAVAFTLAACMDDEMTRPNEARTATVAAHDPSLHGVRASVVAAALPDYTSLDGASAEGVGGSLKLEADAAGAIPRFPDSYTGGVAVFGYAWADLATGRGVVAVIHPAIGRDSNQNPDAWHTHPVVLAGGTGASNFCVVSIGTSQAGIAIVGDRMRVNIAANQAAVSAADLDVTAAFIVQPDAGCKATGLGVSVLSAVSL
jgi:hypothetical protein